LRRLADKVFDGSAELLLTQLVSDKHLTTEELRRLSRLLRERLREQGS
jgi:predicted transcriptional regulator